MITLEKIEIGKLTFNQPTNNNFRFYQGGQELDLIFRP